MVVVYSETITNIKGVHKSPKYFEEPLSGATEVYSNDEAIKKAYKDIGVKVLPITKDKEKKDGKTVGK